MNLKAEEVRLSDIDFLIKLQGGGLYIYPGYTEFNFKNTSVSTNYQALDALIVSKSRDCKRTDRYYEIMEQIASSDFIIWFGVTGQKRSLINQIEEITESIRNLSNTRKKGLFLIDGWTSPIEKTQLDLKEIQNDELIYFSIKDSLPEKVNLHSLIGLTSMEKISIANELSFFVTNNGTGSMYPDRVCGKPGLTHISNAWVESQDFSIHRNSVRLDRNYVSDASTPSTTSRIDHLSYRIEPGIMIKEILRLLKT